MMKSPLKPIVFSDSRVLILGSFPSVISRKEKEYYANPQNRFWKMMEQLFDETIEEKEMFLKKHKIALWDVVAMCELEGSNDATIQKVEVNHFEEIIKKSDIQVLVFNGKKAFEYYSKSDQNIEIDIIHCSSTSSANAAKSIEHLVEEYRKLKEYL